MNDATLLLEALRLAEQGVELTDEQRESIGTVRREITRRRKPKGVEIFRSSLGGYLIGQVFFGETEHRKREIDGFQCLAWLLLRKVEPSITLWSRDTLSKSGLLFRHLEPGVTDGTDWNSELYRNPYQAGERQFYYDIKQARNLIRRLDQLSEMPDSPKRNRTIIFIEGELRTYRYKREIKSFDDEAEKARKNVQKAIKAAISLLIKTPETIHIGLHLQDTVKTGFICDYTGNWKWKF